MKLKNLKDPCEAKQNENKKEERQYENKEMTKKEKKLI